jgi:hypothetical protein
MGMCIESGLVRYQLRVAPRHIGEVPDSSPYQRISVVYYAPMYKKTARVNKPKGEYKPKVSRKNKAAIALMKQLDKQMQVAIERDKS